jgi:hypothetical protein
MGMGREMVGETGRGDAVEVNNPSTIPSSGAAFNREEERGDRKEWPGRVNSCPIRSSFNGLSS